MTLVGGHVALERGEDAAYYPPADVDLSGVDVFGVYVAGTTPHIWTRAEVASLGPRGVRAVLPIVVPHELDPAQALSEIIGLVAAAINWGVPEGAPICFDLEYSLTSAAGEAGTVGIGVRIVQACAAVRRWPWIYAGQTAMGWLEGIAARRWLAEWPNPTPTDPEVPAGFDGWQYASGPVFDLDVFREGVPFMTPDATVAGVLPPKAVPVPMTETAWLVKGSHGWFVTNATLRHFLPLRDPAEGSALIKAGYRTLDLPVEMVDRLTAPKPAKAAPVLGPLPPPG